MPQDHEVAFQGELLLVQGLQQQVLEREAVVFELGEDVA